MIDIVLFEKNKENEERKESVRSTTSAAFSAYQIERMVAKQQFFILTNRGAGHARCQRAKGEGLWNEGRTNMNEKRSEENSAKKEDKSSKLQ